jgi:hypothetical protein
MAKRPQSMVWFDQLFFTAVAITLLISFYTIPQIEERFFGAGAAENPQFAALGGDAAARVQTFVYQMLFFVAAWFFTSRMRFGLARVIVTVFLVINIPTSITTFSVDTLTTSIAALARAVVSFAALILLYCEESRQWFSDQSVGRR